MIKVKTRTITYVASSPFGDVYKEVKMSVKVRDIDTAYFMLIDGIDVNAKRVIAMTKSEQKSAIVFDMTMNMKK